MSHLGNTVEAPSGFEAEFQSVVSELFFTMSGINTEKSSIAPEPSGRHRLTAAPFFLESVENCS